MFYRVRVRFTRASYSHSPIPSFIINTLTFSNIFLVLHLAPRFGKSVIRSCAKLNYDGVQDLFDGRIRENYQFPVEFLEAEEHGVAVGTVATALQRMREIALNRRRTRLENGALVIEKNKKRFELDDLQRPTRFFFEERNEAQYLVEEFMLLANQLVAQKLVETARETAVLRSHRFPQPRKQAFFEHLCASFGCSVDFSSPLALNESLSRILANPDVNEVHKRIIRSKMIRILEQAQYFVVDATDPTQWTHFALNFSVYTHFTSPIRRYPDVLVHRLLHAALLHGREAKQHTDKEKMLAIMERCNKYKLNSRRVSDGADKVSA